MRHLPKVGDNLLASHALIAIGHCVSNWSPDVLIPGPGIRGHTLLNIYCSAKIRQGVSVSTRWCFESRKILPVASIPKSGFLLHQANRKVSLEI